jgi:hypothetical protein
MKNLPSSTLSGFRRKFVPMAFLILFGGAGQFFLAQAGQPYTLWLGLFFYAVAIWKFNLFIPTFLTPKNRDFSPAVEGGLVALILALAFFFRIYRIDFIPSGMHVDQGLIGQCALRILHEGWRPFREVFDYEVPEIALFYQMAGWFGLVGSSYFTFHLFFALLALAAFPLIYWAIRQWAGQSTALLSLFLLAVMRWNWIEPRDGYPSIQVPFYLFGAVAFWFYGHRNGKRWALTISTLFVGAGFYTYQAFKIVPLLMAVFAIDEFLHQKKKSLKPFVLYFLLILALITPLLAVMAQRGNIGHREADLFIGSKVIQEGSLKPLWDVWTGTALMFNRTGDTNPRHNIPGHRMLDDITAVFFILGLALAWRRRKEPGFFYPLVGFGVMSLTGLLSTDPAHSNRLVSLTPFVAFFAGSALDFFRQAAKNSFKRTGLVALILALLLIILTVQNAYTYFVEQANNEDCQNAFGVEQNYIGRNIEDSWKDFPGQDRYFITPTYFQNHTVDFLAYPARSSLFKFNLEDWAAGNIPGDKPILLYLEKGKSGVLGFLKTLYPDLGLVEYPGPPGQPLMDLCRIPIQDRTLSKPWDRGLRGTYINSTDWSAQPVAIQSNPVLNFVSKYDFPFTNFPPFRIRWTGSLNVLKAGDYQFQVLTFDSGQLWLDGKPVPMGKPLRLTAKAHSLRLDFEKDGGDAMALHLVWKKPGESNWEVVPATAFGVIR